MANSDFNQQVGNLPKGRAKNPPDPGGGGGKKAGAAPMPEKPAFPKAALPGKTQPGGRSGGVKPAKVYPKSEGL